MRTMHISPNHTEDDFTYPLTLENKIELFRDRVDGWQLGIADQCINGGPVEEGRSTPLVKDSGFAVMHIVMSYFEMIAKYEHGCACEGASRQYFRYFRIGFTSVFDGLLSLGDTLVDQIVGVLYGHVRCGLYHHGITSPSIVLTGSTLEPIEVRQGKVNINPHLMVPHLRRHLQCYVDRLLDPANKQLRADFEKRWDWQHSQDVELIGG